LLEQENVELKLQVTHLQEEIRKPSIDSELSPRINNYDKRYSRGDLESRRMSHGTESKRASLRGGSCKKLDSNDRQSLSTKKVRFYTMKSPEQEKKETESREDIIEQYKQQAKS